MLILYTFLPLGEMGVWYAGAMAKLSKFTLSYDDKRDNWKLQKDKSHEVVKRFETKADATTGGALQNALGARGGSVKIEYKKSGYEEERTFPRTKDPKSSKG